MNKTLISTALFLALLLACLPATLRAQGFIANAQFSYQPKSDGTFDYTILLQNDSSSTESINTFWFGWVPDVYGYDLLPSNPTITGMPSGWSDYIYNGNYYYPDGYSVYFYNASGADLAPGASYAFTLNTPDAPTTLDQNSPFYGIPALTSYAYGDSGDTQRFQVEAAPVPEPSSIALLALSGTGLLLVVRRRSGLQRQLAANRLSPSPAARGH